MKKPKTSRTRWTAKEIETVRKYGDLYSNDDVGRMINRTGTSVMHQIMKMRSEGKLPPGPRQTRKTDNSPIAVSPPILATTEGVDLYLAALRACGQSFD